MADTTYITNTVEPYVRKWLSSQFAGHAFSGRPVHLVTGGDYKFDAVSSDESDESIVGNILSNRPTTRTGWENTGAVRKALNDIQYLERLPSGVTRVLVFTSEGFRDLIRRRGRRVGAGDIRMLVCPLPAEMRNKLEEVLDAASWEQRSADQ